MIRWERLPAHAAIGFGICIGSLVAMAIAWEMIFPGHVYDCTDDPGFGFFTPGHWLHEPVAVVAKVSNGRPMSEPDVIKAGWTEQGLLAAWWGMIGVAVMAGLAVPCLGLLRGRSGEE